MPDIVIFLGPSLGRAEALSILEAEYLPPICRGDLAQLPAGTKTVGIVDGEFFQSLSVSPKEILVTLDRGIQVFGAASMGALRAAETYMFGMVGVGDIFRMYRDGVLDGDDEVALVYDPHSFLHLSEPLVNIRSALQMALEQGIIGDEEKDNLVMQMKSLYFPHRSYQALQEMCPRLAGFLRSSILPDLKRDDTREMLLAIRQSKHDGATADHR